MSPPLSLEIVATNISLDDNVGAMMEVGGKKQGTRAVASLEMRMRVIASFEVSNPREFEGFVCADLS